MFTNPLGFGARAVTESRPPACLPVGVPETGDLARRRRKKEAPVRLLGRLDTPFVDLGRSNV